MEIYSTLVNMGYLWVCCKYNTPCINDLIFLKLPHYALLIAVEFVRPTTSARLIFETRGTTVAFFGIFLVSEKFSKHYIHRNGLNVQYMYYSQEWRSQVYTYFINSFSFMFSAYSYLKYISLLYVKLHVISKTSISDQLTAYW